MLEIHYEIKFQLYDDMKIENLTLSAPHDRALPYSTLLVPYSGLEH